MARRLNIELADPNDVLGARPGERRVNIWLSEPVVAGAPPADRNVGSLLVADALLVDAQQLTAALAVALGELEVVWWQAGAELPPVKADWKLIKAIRLLRRLFAA